MTPTVDESRRGAPEKDRRRKVVGAVLSERERQEVLGAFRAVGYDKAGHGAREVLLAWARGLLHPIQPPAGVALSPQRPRFPEEDPGA